MLSGGDRVPGDHHQPGSGQAIVGQPPLQQPQGPLGDGVRVRAGTGLRQDGLRRRRAVGHRLLQFRQVPEPVPLRRGSRQLAQHGHADLRRGSVHGGRDPVDPEQRGLPASPGRFQLRRFDRPQDQLGHGRHRVAVLGGGVDPECIPARRADPDSGSARLGLPEAHPRPGERQLRRAVVVRRPAEQDDVQQRVEQGRMDAETRPGAAWASGSATSA